MDEVYLGTDTTGVVTGGVAGLNYGLEGIPKNWIESLVNRYSIFNAAQYLYNKWFCATIKGKGVFVF